MEESWMDLSARPTDRSIRPAHLEIHRQVVPAIETGRLQPGALPAYGRSVFLKVPIGVTVCLMIAAIS